MSIWQDQIHRAEYIGPETGAREPCWRCASESGTLEQMIKRLSNTKNTSSAILVGFVLLGTTCLLASCGPPSPELAAEASVDDGPIGPESQDNVEFVDPASVESTWGTEVAGD